jgi:hypothetical protein
MGETRATGGAAAFHGELVLQNGQTIRVDIGLDDPDDIGADPHGPEEYADLLRLAYRKHDAKLRAVLSERPARHGEASWLPRNSRPYADPGSLTELIPAIRP